jgi:RNA polymerase sigma-70 factor (ECF subfamily)
MKSPKRAASAGQRTGHTATSPTLLVRVRDPSDNTAWTEFETRYRDLIVRYCRRRGLNAADCDDVGQIVWMNLARGLRGFEYDPKRGRFRDYLGRIVNNAISRYFARKNVDDRALDTGVLAVTPDEQQTAADAWEREWVDHHYRLAMRTIEACFDPRSVRVFNRLLAGAAPEDLSREFEISAQAIHQIRYRIKKRMQELIARQIREEDDPDSVPA